MKRWVLCKIESVTDDDLGTWYRMAIQRYPDFNFEFGEIPVDPNTGIPTKTFGFALISSRDMARFRSDNDIHIFPDFPLDAKVNAMQVQTRQGISDAMSRFGVDSQLLTQADGFRDLIRGIGREIRLDFVEDAFDVDEV